MTTATNQKQLKFYKVQYADTGVITYLRSYETLKSCRYYTDNDGNRFLVLGKTTFKYSINDLKNLFEAVRYYDNGTIQHRLANRILNCIKTYNMGIRFSKEEKRALEDIYYYEENLPEHIRLAIKKALNI